MQIWVGEQIKETPAGRWGESAAPTTTCRALSPPEGAEGTASSHSQEDPSLVPHGLGRGVGGRGQVAGLKPPETQSLQAQDPGQGQRWRD